jgi:hypothetical protein
MATLEAKSIDKSELAMQVLGFNGSGPAFPCFPKFQISIPKYQLISNSQ